MHLRFTLPLIFVVVVELCDFSDNLISLNLKTLRRRIYKVNPPPPPKGTITIQTIRSLTLNDV
jgi:hypothetical protein